MGETPGHSAKTSAVVDCNLWRRGGRRHLGLSANASAEVKCCKEAEKRLGLSFNASAVVDCNCWAREGSGV